jgi:hypothetical protein
MKQGSNQAVRFLVYNDLKKVFEKQMPQTPAMLLAGGIAGATSVYGKPII